MPTTTIRPDGTLSNNTPGSTTFLTGGTGTVHGNTSDNSDTSFHQFYNGGNASVSLGTFSLPAGAAVYQLQQRLRYDTGAATPVAVVSVLLGTTLQAYSSWPQASAGIATNSATAFGVTWAPGTHQANIDALTAAWSNSAAPGAGTMDIYEYFLDVIYALVPGTATVSAPTGTITTAINPTVTWTHTPGSGAPGGQTNYQVKIFSAAQYGIGGFDPATSPCTYDSGFQSGSGSSFSAYSGLSNGVTYKAYVLTGQTSGGVVQAGTVWGAGPAFTLALVPSTPTAVTPANGTTVTTSTPALSANVAAMASNWRQRREFNLATNVGFTTGVLTFLEPIGNLAVAPTGNYAFPTGRLAQGSWWIRVRSMDESGVYGAYSTINAFTVAHVPSTTNRTPSLGGTVAYNTSVQVNWTFSDIDTLDSQSKYQVQMWKTSTPGTVLDSGLVTSANAFHLFTSGIDATWKDTEIRWKVLVQDSDGVSSGYSIEQTFFLSDTPTITLTTPTAAQVLTTSAPLFAWTFAGTRSRTPVQFKVDVTNVTAGTLAITSGWITSTALVWQTPSPAINISTNYSVTVSVIDSLGLTGVSTNAFTATYAAPTVPSFTVNGTAYRASSLNTVDWSGATLDANFSAWRVYRRVTGTSAWTLLVEYTSPTTRSYKDYTAPSLVSMDYAVVQVDISFGIQVESVYSPFAITGTADFYQLVCPTQDSLNLTLYGVKADSFADEQEMATLNLFGRGRRVEYGTRFGQQGTLVTVFRNITNGPTARSQRLALEALRSSGRDVYLTNPFGDIWRVAMQSATITRVPGTGLHEVAEASISYSEITA